APSGSWTRWTGSAGSRSRRAYMLRAKSARRRAGALARGRGGCAHARRRTATAGPDPPGARRLIRRHQLMFRRPDQIRTPHAPQRLAQRRPVVRIVIAQERLVQSALTQSLRNEHRLAVTRDALEWILAAVIHRGRGRHGTG